MALTLVVVAGCRSPLGIFNKQQKVVGIFLGEIEDDINGQYLECDYTCAHSGGSRGELLRYYALLKAHNKNNNINHMRVFPAGGIPALQNSDSREMV